ncbi:MAG TPA: polysaccharide biosynthesis/export family protein, partial [Candidatus Elarobacter sp.]
MLTRSTHSIRALAAAVAAILLATQFPAGAAQAPAPAAAPGATAPASPAPGPASLPDAGPASVSPVIHPGDTLSISVFEEPSLPQSYIVQADGTIQFPLAGRLLVAGLSAAEARDVVTRALKKYFKHPSVTLAVAQQGLMNVLVYGNVKTTGKYQLRSGARLGDALAASGGVAVMNGEYPTARVSELDGTMATVSLEKFLRQGDATQNVALEDNSIVYVNGGETIRVQVLGAVSRPGNVEVQVGDRLTMALARAGAEAGALSDLNRVYLTRIDPATGKTTPSYEINVYVALQRGDQRYDPILQKDDKI